MLTIAYLNNILLHAEFSAVDYTLNKPLDSLRPWRYINLLAYLLTKNLASVVPKGSSRRDIQGKWRHLV